MEEEEKSNFRKYVGLYFDRSQRESYQSMEKGWNIDILWPFKFVWFVLKSIWQGISGERR